MNNKFFRTLHNGFNSLMLQRMRAGLAGLGIFIGTTTVIWLVAMGEGVSYRAQQQILELGAKNIIVRTVEPIADSDVSAANRRVKRYGLFRDDHERIVTNIPTVKSAIPMREVRFELRVVDRSVDA